MTVRDEERWRELDRQRERGRGVISQVNKTTRNMTFKIFTGLFYRSTIAHLARYLADNWLKMHH